MDWSGPTFIAAVVSAIFSFVGVIVSTLTARALHTEKLDSERTLAERKFEFDKDLSERKFRYEQDLHDHRRRIELAEQALAAFHEAKGDLGFSLIPNPIGEEDSTRKSQVGESIIQKKNRDSYFLPIQRLIQCNVLFSKIASFRFPFIAYSGEAAVKPFEEIFSVHQEIIDSAKILVDTSPSGEDEYQNWSHMNEGLRSTVGRGPTVQNRHRLQLRIDKTFVDIETICRPVLDRKAGE